MAVKKAPIPAKYATLPEDVARTMMQIDADRATPAYKKSAAHAASAGGVIDTGSGVQGGQARAAAAAAAAAAAIQRKNAKETAGLQSALKGGLGGGLRGRANRMNKIVGRIK